MKRIQIDLIDPEYAAILAIKTPAERVGMVVEAHRMARMLAASGARLHHPDWTEDQIQAEVAKRLLHGQT